MKQIAADSSIEDLSTETLTLALQVGLAESPLALFLLALSFGIEKG